MEQDLSGDGGDRSNLRLDKIADSITYKRLNKVMNQLKDCKSDCVAYPIISVLFGDESTTTVSPPGKETRWKAYSKNLNESQMNSINASLHAREISVIHGPPGTGKTTTVVEFIRQCVARLV